MNPGKRHKKATKAELKLQARIKDYERTKSESKNTSGYHKPGSNKK